ncbi:diguanylate cyclase (GGDEF)-like protein [Amorphus suaedae]
MDDVHDKFFELYEQTAVLVAAYDGFDRLRYANAAFRAAFFVEEGETPFWADIMRRNHRAGRGTIIRNPDFESWLKNTQSRRGKTGYRAFETDLADGRWLLMTETVSADGWMLCVASDITSLRSDDREVRQDRDFAIKASHTDELTGIANRRYTMARAEEMLASARPDDVAGCFVLIDLDFFKSINDRFGHQSGDRVLQDFAERLQGLVRRLDCFGRVGGEEFALVLPGTTAAEAELIVGKMLSLTRMASPLPDRPGFTYSFSAGISVGDRFDSVSELYARADRALYVAKVGGRDRIEVDHRVSGRSSAAC